MEATAIAGLEWACLHEWAARVGPHKDWVQWMYARVGALTETIMDQRTEWRAYGKEHPDVLQRVTREILRPVIEAIVQDEINSKKS